MLPDQSPWEVVLDRLEEGVAAAVREMEDPNGAPRIELWSPPAGLGPVPEALAPRMARLIASQKALLESMERRRREFGSQMNAVRQVPLVSTGSRSLYLDISG